MNLPRPAQQRMYSAVSRRRLLASAAALTALGGIAGCRRGPKPVEGGTRGVVRAGAVPLREVRVTVYPQADATATELGHAVTAPDGSFALVKPQAAGPLFLPPGEYRITLESVGAEPLRFSPAIGDRRKSPLVVTHRDETALLDVNAPAPQ
ncbi:MAG TPA: hypothetical protein VGE52_12090 [Pirellulales bacterium]